MKKFKQGSDDGGNQYTTYEESDNYDYFVLGCITLCVCVISVCITLALIL